MYVFVDSKTLRTIFCKTKAEAMNLLRETVSERRGTLNFEKGETQARCLTHDTEKPPYVTHVKEFLRVYAEGEGLNWQFL